MEYHKLQNSDEEIDLMELFLALWSRRLIIILTTLSASIFSVIYSVSLPNLYLSSSVLAPSEGEASFGSRSGGISALASLSGLGMGSSPASKSEEAIERIQSFDFFVKEFIPAIKFENLVASKEWTQAQNIIIYDESIFNSKNKEWVRKVKYPKSIKPSHQEAYEIYIKILSVSKYKSSPFFIISITEKINNHMRELDISVAQEAINFLNITSQKTNLSEIKVAISSLLEDQIKTLMLAEATKDYVLKPIISPIAPEKKYKPFRAFICLLGAFTGFLIGIFIAFYLYYFKDKIPT